MGHEFKLKRLIEFAETDLAGIMHFSNFFRLMEATEHAFFRSLGFSIQGYFNDEIIGWPRVHTECDFRRPLKFEEEVEIHLLVKDIGRKSITYDFVFRKENKRGRIVECAHGETKAVCVRFDKETGTMESTEIPEEIRNKIEVAPAFLQKS